MLSFPICKLSYMTYGERLDAAIRLAGSSRKLVAKAAGVTEQAVGQCIRGETEFLKVESSARAAAFLDVDHFWLATGEGKARPDRAWPFELFSRPDYMMLSQKDREDAENALAGAIQRLKQSKAA
ncbi:hypothetical protein [Polaromonas sp.]|uniref:hypothetical protein n=1 Tax=Polaromonas sp. TaxID=1869339 RepID=UPI0032660994